MSAVSKTEQTSDVKYDTDYYDDEYMDWISKNYNTPVENLKQMTNEELSAFLKNAFALEKEQKKIKEKNAFEAVDKTSPRISFEEKLGGTTVNGYELDDGYWNLFCIMMDLLPEDSKSNKGKTVSEFWDDIPAVARLYVEMYGWVDQDMEGFGLVGNLAVSLNPGFDRQKSEFEYESFDFKKAIEVFEEKFMVL